MLPIDRDMTEEQKAQFILYQLKVLTKALVQLNRNFENKDQEKFDKVLTMLLTYGKVVSSSEFEFELEKNLVLHSIFEDIRDFV